MINTSDRPIFLVDGEVLDREVREALSWAETVLMLLQTEGGDVE